MRLAVCEKTQPSIASAQENTRRRAISSKLFEGINHHDRIIILKINSRKSDNNAAADPSDSGTFNISLNGAPHTCRR